jgi:hypothetical protein
MGPGILETEYHLKVITQSTRTLDERFPDVHDEIISSVEDGLSAVGDYNGKTVHA